MKTNDSGNVTHAKHQLVSTVRGECVSLTDCHNSVLIYTQHPVRQLLSSYISHSVLRQ